MYPEPEDWNGIKSKINGVVSHGLPVCDMCRDMAPEKRPNYTTDNPTLIIDTEGRTLGDWMGKTLCPVHSEGCISGTHKVTCEMKDAEDYDLKTGYRYEVVGIERL